jgi:hypothetical protein
MSNINVEPERLMGVEAAKRPVIISPHDRLLHPPLLLMLIRLMNTMFLASSSSRGPRGLHIHHLQQLFHVVIIVFVNKIAITITAVTTSRFISVLSLVILSMVVTVL